MTATLVLFVAYLVATTGIGFWAATRARGTQEDYFLGGRRLGAFAMALSAVSSGRSAWLVIGASAFAWSVGLSALWVFPGYVAAEALMFVGPGPRLRERSAELGAITIPEVLAALPRGRARAVRPLAALVTIAFLGTYVSAQLGAGAKTFAGIFDVEDGTWGLVVTAGIVLVYTLMGGYRAVVVTDVVQACLMLLGMIVLPLLGLIQVGGFGALAERLRELDPELLDLSRGWLPLLGGLSIGFGSFGNPHILVRHMSLEDPARARAAMLTGTAWNVVMAAGALLLGLVGRAIYSSADALAGDGKEFLFATLARDLSERYLFAGFAGLMLATLFAAIMSTCDSQLLVVASSVVRDLRPGGPAAGRGSLLASRLAVLATLTGAVALSYGDVPLVNDLVLLSWAALGAGFGPAILMSLYDDRTTARGVLAGIVVGAGGVLLAWFCWAAPRAKHVDYELALAFVLSCATIYALRDRRAEP